MRKVIYSFIAATVFMFAASFANAQQQKIAHVNSNDILALMPETKLAQTEIETLQKKKQDEMQLMAKERETKLKAAQDKYKEIQATKQDPDNDTQLKSMSADLEQLDQRLQQSQQAAQKEIQDKQQALVSPIQQKVLKAISDVAKAKNIGYVFDLASGALIYHDGGVDLTAEVKAKLGIK